MSVTLGGIKFGSRPPTDMQYEFGFLSEGVLTRHFLLILCIEYLNVNYAVVVKCVTNGEVHQDTRSVQCGGPQLKTLKCKFG